MPSNQKQGVSKTESWLNVASIIPNAGVKNNPTVGRNTKVSIVGDKSNSWGTSFSPNNVMVSKNKVFTTIASCSNVDSMIPNPGVYSNPMVGMNTKLINVGDMTSSWGKPFLPMPYLQNRIMVLL